jgi:hypothetical protein
MEKSNSVVVPSMYVGPILSPPNDQDLVLKIKDKLLRYELPVSCSQKAKLIKPETCLAILGELGLSQSQYQQFIKQKFLKLSSNQLDLSGIVSWLYLHSSSP